MKKTVRTPSLFVTFAILLLFATAFPAAAKSSSYKPENVTEIVVKTKDVPIAITRSSDNAIHIDADGEAADGFTRLEGDKRLVVSTSSVFAESIRVQLPDSDSLVLILETDSEDIALEGIWAKKVTATSKNGAISLENCQLDTAILESANGAIEMKDSQSKTVKAISKNGVIDLQADGIANATLKSSTGDIFFKTSAKSPKVQAITAAGNVEITLPKDASLKYSFSSTVGSFRLNGKSAKVAGALGKGRGNLRIETKTGDAQISTQ